jgi:hypothetical protein
VCGGGVEREGGRGGSYVRWNVPLKYWYWDEGRGKEKLFMRRRLRGRWNEGRGNSKGNEMKGSKVTSCEIVWLFKFGYICLY